MTPNPGPFAGAGVRDCRALYPVVDAEPERQGMAVDDPPATERAKVRVTLFAAATTVRAFLLPHWQCWHQAWGPPDPVTPSQWTCVRSSMLLARAFDRDGIPATLRSGRPRHARMGNAHACHGLLTVDGRVSHAWVEAENFVIDVTADQFGHAPAVVTPADDPAYRSAKEQAYQLVATPAGLAAVEAIWPLWCAYADRERLIPPDRTLDHEPRDSSSPPVRNLIPKTATA